MEEIDLTDPVDDRDIISEQLSAEPFTQAINRRILQGVG